MVQLEFLFCICIDGLLQVLCDSKVDADVGNVYAGALAYADDIALLAPTTTAMRLL